MRATVRAGHWLYHEYARHAASLRQDEMTAGDLMRAAIIFRTYYEFLDRLPVWMSKGRRAQLFNLRQECRQRLRQVVSPEPLPPYVTLSNRLQPQIEKGHALLRWVAFAYAAEEGVVIIPGDFDQGPWHAYVPGDSHPAQPCFLITDELYPDIYPLFPHIKGIICDGGGMNSHPALLAREWGMSILI